MKCWIRPYPDTPAGDKEMIASLDQADGETKLWITPTQDDPAETIPSWRDDGYEQIVWRGVTHLVQSIDLDFENTPLKESQ
jgi:hypothetical protein|tara:strand:- start:1328 stop:1570 length:243 start_codon:yes stop_codon:yes gene_type:complete